MRFLTLTFYFRTDTEAELNLVQQVALQNGAFDAVLCNHWAEGGPGALHLAESVIKASEQVSSFRFLYDLNLSIEDKLNVIAQEMYGASGVELTTQVQEAIRTYTIQVLDL